MLPNASSPSSDAGGFGIGQVCKTRMKWMQPKMFAVKCKTRKLSDEDGYLCPSTKRQERTNQFSLLLRQLNHGKGQQILRWSKNTNTRPQVSMPQQDVRIFWKTNSAHFAQGSLPMGISSSSRDSWRLHTKMVWKTHSFAKENRSVSHTSIPKFTVG